MTYCTRTRHGVVDETTPGGRVFNTCRQHARRRRAPHLHASPAEHYELLRLLDDQEGLRALRGRSRSRRIGWLLQRMAGRSQLRPIEPLAAPPASIGRTFVAASAECSDSPTAKAETEATAAEGEGITIDLTTDEGRAARTASAALASLAAHRALGRKARP